MRRPLLIVLALLATGCGNSRTRPPEVRTPVQPEGSRPVRLAAGEIRFTAPVNWNDITPMGQRVGGIQSRRALVAVWRYERSEPLPETEDQLERVAGLLVDRVKQRDPTFTLSDRTVTRRGGARAIELRGRQTIAGQPREVRSAHVFHDGAEIVLDAYAPPEDFARVDASVFRPLLESLRLR